MNHTLSSAYFAADDSMGDLAPADGDRYYRAWALKELERAYPHHETQVIAEPHMARYETDNEEMHEEIADFCSRLWDRYSG